MLFQRFPMLLGICSICFRRIPNLGKVLYRSVVTTISFLFGHGSSSLFCLLGRLAVEPQDYEGEEASDHSPNPSDPGPCARNSPGAWPLIVCKMAHGHLSLFLHIGEKRALVVDLEGKDAMLIG